MSAEPLPAQAKDLFHYLFRQASLGDRGDRGVGLDGKAARQSRGLGLVSREERLKLLTESNSIESQPNRGTTIHALCLSAEGAISCVPPGKRSKLDFFVHLIDAFISGLEES